eukprot:554267_1
MQIAVGCTTTKCDDFTDSKQLYSIEKIIVHKGWGNISIWLQNDIAIIFLTEPINHTNAIPIIIESDPMIAENNGKVKITGYSGYGGPDSRGGSDKTELEYGWTNIMPRDECKAFSLDYDERIVSDNDICMKDDVGVDGMVASCKGDSGSPLLYQGKQIALVSWAFGNCD